MERLHFPERRREKKKYLSWKAYENIKCPPLLPPTQPSESPTKPSGDFYWKVVAHALSDIAGFLLGSRTIAINIRRKRNVREKRKRIFLMVVIKKEKPQTGRTNQTTKSNNRLNLKKKKIGRKCRTFCCWIP